MRQTGSMGAQHFGLANLAHRRAMRARPQGKIARQAGFLQRVTLYTSDTQTNQPYPAAAKAPDARAVLGALSCHCRESGCCVIWHLAVPHLECEDSSAERERDGAGEYDRQRVERDALDGPERNTYVKRQQISATRGTLVQRSSPTSSPKCRGVAI